MNHLKILFHLILGLGLGFGSPAFTQDKKNSNADSDKLDIQKLEQKYWSAKDDDFSVIQNRSFSKEKRWFLTFNYGTPYNDPNSVGNIFGLNLGYFFNERWGLELNYNQASFKNNDSVEAYKNRNATIPDHNRYAGAQSLMAYWVPIYAKMSLLDKKIIYFDMGIGAGLGQTQFIKQICDLSSGSCRGDVVEIKSSGFHYAINVFQQFFISNSLALRVDFINRWTNEERLRFYRTSVSSDLESAGNKLINDTALQIGITYWK